MTTGEQSLLFEVRDQREPGWFHIDNEIVDKFGGRLEAYGLAVYAVLCRHCKSSTQQVNNLSQRDIAAALGISQDRVRKSLFDLVELRLIHIDLPARPAPGIISTITLLKVKTTERHTFSSVHELNATRSPNKEEKTKTETNPPLPPLFQRGVTRRDFRNLRKSLDQFYKRIHDEAGWLISEFRELTPEQLTQMENEYAAERLMLPLADVREMRQQCGAIGQKTA